MANSSIENERKQEKKRSTFLKNEVTEKAIKTKVDALKMEQNHEMLLVLEEEQANEAMRDELYRKSTDPREKKKMEATFSTKRAKAISRIQDLTM